MVMQQDQYAYPAPSTFDPTQVYVPNRFQQTYAPQSYVDQYGLQSAFPLVPGLPVPGGEGGGEAPPVIQEPPPVIQPPIDGFTPQTFMDTGTYENPGDLGSGGAPAPEGGLFQQEGAPTYEGIGMGSGEVDDQGNPFLDPWVIGGLVGATGALAAPWLWANRPFNDFRFGNITEPRQRQVGTEGEAWRGRPRPTPGAGDDADTGGRRQITARGGGRRMLPSGSEGDGGNPRVRTGGGSGTVARMDTPYRDRLLREMGRRGYRWDGRTWVRVGPDAPSETPRIRVNPRVGNLLDVAPPRAVGLSSFGEFPTSQAAAQIRGNPWFNQRVPYSMQSGNVNAALGRGPTAVITNPFTPRPR